jgi:prophage DNA circulation protein
MSHKELIAAKLREAESKVTQVAIDRIRSAMEAREIDQLRVAISIGQVSPPSEELAQLISLAQTLLDQLIIEREQEIVTNGALIALQKALSSKILSDLTSALNQARSAPTNSPSSAEMLNLIPKAETLLEEIKLAAAEFNLIADSKLGLSNALEDTKHASEPLRRAIEVSHKVKISSIDHDVVKSFAEHQELLLKAESTLIDWIKTEDAVEILKQAVSAHQFGILQNAIKVAEYVLPSPALLSQSELAQKILAELLQFRNEILTRLKDALFARQIIELAHAVDHAKAHSAPILTTGVKSP